MKYLLYKYSYMKLPTGDVTILYQGGSGGFLLFYYLLLSGRYETGLEFDSVQDLISKQFPEFLESCPQKWKATEFWPDNEHCRATKTGHKLFLICNPCWDANEIKKNKVISQGSHQILLYTDIHTQLRMAYEKRAYWFTDTSKTYFNAPSNEKLYIKNIINNSTHGYDPMVKIVEHVFRPQQKLLLQDFLTAGEIVGFSSPTKQQSEFVEYWKKIQPPKVRRFL